MTVSTMPMARQVSKEAQEKRNALQRMKGRRNIKLMMGRKIHKSGWISDHGNGNWVYRNADSEVRFNEADATVGSTWIALQGGSNDRHQ